MLLLFLAYSDLEQTTPRHTITLCVPSTQAFSLRNQEMKLLHLSFTNNNNNNNNNCLLTIDNLAFLLPLFFLQTRHLPNKTL